MWLKHFTSQGLLSYKEYGFHFSRSIVDVLIVINENYCQALDDEAQSMALDIFLKAFDRAWYVDLHGLKSYGIPGQIFDSIFIIKLWN